MGQSLPLPTDAQSEPHGGVDRVDSTRVTLEPRRRRKVDAASQASPPSPAIQATGIDAFNAAIVRNKVRMPDIPQHTLERPRLLGWVEDQAHRRVRVLTAEAGYGKSTLIADHAKRSGRRLAWLRLESNDVDWVGMLSYLVASVREVIPDFATGAINLLQRVGVLNATRDMVLDMILAELDSMVTEPLTLVLDDFHVVQDGEDVRAILARLLELAPAPMSFIIAGHRHPGALLARPTGQGQVAELGTQELRFTRAESGRLITEILGGPLDDDLMQILDERLAGWAASIQLVATSLVGRSASDVRNAVEDLSSRSEPLYDFLAAQVLVRASGPMQRVLWVASLLERVETSLVIAALGNDGRSAGRRVGAILKQAEQSGVITRLPGAGQWWRFHPLVRDFMSSSLVASTSRRALLAMHLRVAKAAEPLDWASSAHHYIEAEHRADAMRVLRDSAITAIGTASWGAATALVDRMPDQPIPEAVNVLRAYGLAARGQAPQAIALLQSLSPAPDDTVAWGLTRVALASLYLVTGQLPEIRLVLADLDSRNDLGPVIASLARGVAAILDAHGGGHLLTASETFEEMAGEHARLGLTYFAGVSYHNCALSLFARGQYQGAVAMGRKGVEQFDRTPSRHGVDSTHALLALAHAELGQDQRAAEHLDLIPLGPKTLADAQADAAWIAAAKGNTANAWVLVERAAAGSRDAPRTPGAFAATQYSRVLALLVEGSVDAAAQVLAEARTGSVELDAVARHLTLGALVALTRLKHEEARTIAVEGLGVAESQGAHHWTRCLRVIEAVAGADSDGFRRALTDLTSNARLSTLVMADAVAMGLGMSGQVPSEILDLVRTYPARWLPALRRVIRGDDRSAAMVCAEVLSTTGTSEDVALLSSFERKAVRQVARRRLSRGLARHISPTLVVHDLGRLQIQVGKRVVPLSQSRRKAAAMLALLASRPSHAATRDHVLDTLWPNQSPDGASNSLHQTLFFLRRDIDPAYEDGCSVDYVVVEPDIVYLDAELVQVDSAAFFRQVSAVLTSGQLSDLGPPLLRDYQAKFALDFEYEDWSSAWRDQLHSMFLDATQATAKSLLDEGREPIAIDIIQRALMIDPTALDLEACLIQALHAAGATAAVANQYRHYAQAVEEETGEPAPLLSVLLPVNTRQGGV